MAMDHWSLRRRQRPITCLGDVSEIMDGGRSEFARTIPRDFEWRGSHPQVVGSGTISPIAENLDLLHAGTTAMGIGMGKSH